MTSQFLHLVEPTCSHHLSNWDITIEALHVLKVSFLVIQPPMSA
jgi:hypothetical protein